MMAPEQHRGARLRVLLHALDRTGPPMLGLAAIRWISAHRPDLAIDVVAFRSGPMLGDIVRHCPVHVVLDPDEPWDHRHPDLARSALLSDRLSMLDRPDVVLAISVAAGQVVPLLPRPLPPLVSWVVEQGEDLHWLDQPIGLAAATTRWLAGSAGTAAELGTRLGSGVEVHLAPEFVSAPAPADPEVIRRCRDSLDPRQRGLLVVGAGIATRRKAPDLFLEVALAHQRRSGPSESFVWIGGERDTFFPLVRQEADRLGLDAVRFAGNVDDITPWLAAADVFVHCARLDAFPLVCLHAALAGTPVIGFGCVSGLEEMFGSAARCVDYPDVNALADQLTTLRSPDARRSLAREQGGVVRERFVADAAAPVLAEHLDATLRMAGAT